MSRQQSIYFINDLGEFRPYKPDPAPLLHICSSWNIQPNEVKMVGDSLKDDIACGKRAGAFTSFLDQSGRYEDSQEFPSAKAGADASVERIEIIKALALQKKRAHPIKRMSQEYLGENLTQVTHGRLLFMLFRQI
ncbi:hypothetical protein SAY87_008338 [Trapa incisa]|uniref:Uncharacterized protein n=1 Tax=Trapa incisa TaxID=236973 RepID=A0AAN7QFX2_9MYRT|nr:hypothetical protein SAY87_008338 [Trapa incisa]